MSWNEPGGKKDPWSGRDRQDGPPDLEEIMRGMEDRIARFFRGRSPMGGDTNTQIRIIGSVVLIGLGIWALTGIYLVDEGSRGVLTRFGAYLETSTAGLHWRLPAPIDKVEVVNVDQQRFLEIGYRSGGRQQAAGSVPKEALMLTQDENIIDIRLAVQYQVKDARAYLFNVTDPDVTLRQVIESAQRGVIGRNTMDYVLTERRGPIANEIKVEIQKTLDQYGIGIQIINVSLVGVQAPDEVQSAFEDAIKAREDEQRLKNEAEAYANEVIPKARGAAARLIEESEAYKQRAISRAEGEASRFGQLLTEYEKAPEVTRERMYLDAMQEVLSQANTILIDVKSSNNLLYLPVDKLQKPSSPAVAAGFKETEITVPNSQESTESGVRGLRPMSSRGREGRGQ